MTVAAYMTEILTHPASGYYMGKDVLGPDGDFITSPEISQMFGELIGLWFVSEWVNAGAPGNCSEILVHIVFDCGDEEVGNLNHFALLFK